MRSPNISLRDGLMMFFLQKCSYNFFFEEAFDDTIGDNVKTSDSNRQLDPSLTIQKLTPNVISETNCIEKLDKEQMSEANEKLYEGGENNPAYENDASSSKNQCTDIDAYFIKKLKQVTGLDNPKALSIDSAIKLVHAMVDFSQNVNSTKNVSKTQITQKLEEQSGVKGPGSLVRKYNYQVGTAKYNASVIGFNINRIPNCPILSAYKRDEEQHLEARTLKHNISNLARCISHLASRMIESDKLPQEEESLTKLRKSMSKSCLENGSWMLFLIENPLQWVTELDSLFRFTLNYQGATMTKFWNSLKGIVNFFKMFHTTMNDLRSQTAWFKWSNESAVDKKCDLCIKQIEKLHTAANKTKTRQDTGKKLIEVVASDDLDKQSWGTMMKIIAELAETTENHSSIEDIIVKGLEASLQDAQHFQFFLMACLIYRTGQRSEWVQNLTLAEWVFSKYILNDNSGDMVCCLTNHKNVKKGQMAFAFLEKKYVEYFDFFRKILRKKLIPSAINDNNTEGCEKCSTCVDLPHTDVNFSRKSVQMQTIKTQFFL